MVVYKDYAVRKRENLCFPSGMHGKAGQLVFLCALICHLKPKTATASIPCKLLFLLLVLSSCSPTIVVSRQFGLTEITSTIDSKQIIKIDTVQYGEGFVKRVTYKVKQSEYEKSR